MPLSHTKREELKGDYYKFYYENKGNFLPAEIADYWLKVLEEELQKREDELVEKIENCKKPVDLQANYSVVTDVENRAFNKGMSVAINIINNQ